MPYPGFIKFCVLAIARVQRHRVRWNTGKQDLVDGLFKYVQAGDTEDAVDVSRNDDLKDNRRAFCDKHFVTELFRSNFIVRNRTRTAFLAIKAKLIIICWTTFCMFQAVG